MNFEFGDEQRLLKDSVERLLGERYDFAQRQKYAMEPDGWSRPIWAQFAELGLLGLPFAEADGGFGGGAVEMMIVMEAFGRALALEPYFATVVLGGNVLRHAAPAALRAELVPEIAAGKLLLGFAQQERHSRHDLADITTLARRDGDGWAISGEKSLVLHGDCADKLIVTARSSGDRRDRHGIGLFLVDAADPAVHRRGYPTQDAMRAAEIRFDDARGIAIGDPEDALPVIERVVDAAIAALCAEAVGVMGAMLDSTVGYLKTRRQFGRAIGEFQALQHRTVDMYVSLELARSMALLATMTAEEDDAEERRRAIAAAKVQIGRSGRKIGQEAIQLHGGIGVTMEYGVGHHFKRMTMIDRAFGDADHHLGVLAR